jgi:hypothetical protein
VSETIQRGAHRRDAGGPAGDDHVLEGEVSAKSQLLSGNRVVPPNDGHVPVALEGPEHQLLDALRRNTRPDGEVEVATDQRVDGRQRDGLDVEREAGRVTAEPSEHGA